MDAKVEIQILGKSFKLDFSLEVFLKLGEIWGVDTLEEVNQKFQVFNEIGEGGKTPLSRFVLLSEIVSAVLAVNNEEGITPLEIRSLKIHDFEKLMVDFMAAFIKNQTPQEQVEEGKKHVAMRNKVMAKKNL
jgi:hypothetical protein